MDRESRPPTGTEPTAGGAERWVEFDRPFEWSDLLVPEREHEQLRALANRAQTPATTVAERDDPAGVISLFVGESGTGKTMAAQVLGAELGRPVHEVDLQRLQLDDDAEIESVFAAAERRNAVLVFDANRSPSGSDARAEEQDSAAAIDASSVVRRCWRYPGLVIFTWIPGRFFHQALAEHAPALVHPSVGMPVRFPFPAARTRVQLWRAALPAGTQVSEFALQHLAGAFALSGGAIRRCCRVARAAARKERVPLTTALLIDTISRLYPGTEITEQAHVELPVSDFGDDAGGPFRVSPRGARRMLVAVGAVAALAGIALARTTSSGTALVLPDKQASSAALHVTVPSSWRQQSQLGGLAASGLTDRLGLTPGRPGRGLLVLGQAQSTDPTRLVEQLTGVQTAPSPQIVSLRSTRFYRYSGVLPSGSGSPESVYLLPTTTGTIVGMCVPQTAGGGFTATCERVLASIKPVGGDAVGAGPNTTVGVALGRVIAGLGAARGAAEHRLSAARTATAQASAAGALATAYSRAASGVQDLQAGAASTATDALASAFTSTAGAYSAIAHAAAHNDARAYRTANAQLTTAAGAVNAAVRQLRALGYEIA